MTTFSKLYMIYIGLNNEYFSAKFSVFLGM